MKRGSSSTSKHLRDEHIILGVLRIVLGFIFLWAFLDKLFGLGFATTPEKSWLSGNSPTAGFLNNAVHGPFVTLYHSLGSASHIVDWIFMIGILLIGLALIFGILVRVASYSAAILLFLMYLSLLPPDNNPLIDEHIVYVIVMIAFAVLDSGDWLGFGKKWSNTKLVKNKKWLK